MLCCVCVCLCTCMCVVSRTWLFVAPWTIGLQVPLPMGSPRQEFRSREPFPTPGDLPNPGMEPKSFVSPALTGRFFTTSATWEAQLGSCCRTKSRQRGGRSVSHPSSLLNLLDYTSLAKTSLHPELNWKGVWEKVFWFPASWWHSGRRLERMPLDQLNLLAPSTKGCPKTLPLAVMVGRWGWGPDCRSWVKNWGESRRPRGWGSLSKFRLIGRDNKAWDSCWMDKTEVNDREIHFHRRGPGFNP